MRTRLPLILLLLLAVLGVASAGKGAKAKQVRFVGVHPIPKVEGSGFCHIEAPHVHVYVPADVKVQYRVHDDDYYFVGDPVAYGWDGDRYAYYGHHPVAVDVVLGDDGDDVEHCYLDGAHYHGYMPPPALEFELEAGAYWYVGAPAPAYLEARAVLDPIDVVYQPIVYERPAVVVDVAPRAWIGLHVDVITPHVEVVAPVRRAKKVRSHVDVEIVAPSLVIEVGVFGSHRHGKHKHHGKHKGKKHGHGRGHDHDDHDDD